MTLREGREGVEGREEMEVGYMSDNYLKHIHTGLPPHELWQAEQKKNQNKRKDVSQNNNNWLVLCENE